jgi:asparagine synthase (glutamine-hydrolysing)
VAIDARSAAGDPRALTPREQMLWPGWVHWFKASHPGAHRLPLKVVFPFFDVRLAEYVLATPPSPWRRRKRLLREAMRGRLPEEVRRRPKTVLYRNRRRADADQLWYQIAQQPQTKRWRRELIEAAPLERFLDVKRILGVIEAPQPVPAELFGLQNCLSLAHWLRYTLPSGPPADKESVHVAE